MWAIAPTLSQAAQLQIRQTTRMYLQYSLVSKHNVVLNALRLLRPAEAVRFIAYPNSHCFVKRFTWSFTQEKQSTARNGPTERLREYRRTVSINRNSSALP